MVEFDTPILNRTETKLLQRTLVQVMSRRQMLKNNNRISLQSVDQEDIKKPARFTNMVVYTLPIVKKDVSITCRDAMASSEADDRKSVMDK